MYFIYVCMLLFNILKKKFIAYKMYILVDILFQVRGIIFTVIDYRVKPLII